jgi:hypothetical protein
MRDELAARVGTEMDAFAQAADVAAEEEEMEEAEEAAPGGIEALSYDQLLELGDRIGDVAKERWAKRSAQFIATLPKCVHVVAGNPAPTGGLPHSSQTTALGDSADRCLVCQCEYEHGEILSVLSCQHLYHNGRLCLFSLETI